MKVGIAADHGGYEMKEKLYILLGAIGHEVVDFGNCNMTATTTTRTLSSPCASGGTKNGGTRRPAVRQRHRGIYRSE